MARQTTRLRRVAFPIRVAVLIVIIVCCIVASFVAGRLFKPQSNVLADAAQATIPVTAIVQDKEIDTNLSFTGTVKEGKSAEISPAGLPQLPVVTRISVRPGDTVQSGTLLGTIANSPVFAVYEPLPLYRDIAAGDEGDDVKALQRGLINLGYLMKADGKAGSVTLSAVRDLFDEHGFTLPRRQKPFLTSETKDSAETDGKTEEPPNDQQAVYEPYIPAQAFVSIPSSEVQVLKAAKVAETLSDEIPFLSVQYKQGTVEFRADPVTVESLEEGQEVMIEAGTTKLSAIIENIGEFSSGGESENPGRTVSVVSGEAEFDDLVTGEPVIVRTTGQPDKGKGVPVASIRKGADGDYVVKRTGSHDPHLASVSVKVEIISNSNGWAIVKSDDLQIGDEVEL